MKIRRNYKDTNIKQNEEVSKFSGYNWEIADMWETNWNCDEFCQTATQETMEQQYGMRVLLN